MIAAFGMAPSRAGMADREPSWLPVVEKSGVCAVSAWMLPPSIGAVTLASNVVALAMGASGVSDAADGAGRVAAPIRQRKGAAAKATREITRMIIR
ncbi:MAG TPA: hypothetical protein VGC10_00295 [Sphingomonas sp.]